MPVERLLNLWNVNKDIEPTIEQFAAVACGYCAWVESTPVEPFLGMKRAQELLAKLHLAAVKLPEVEPERDVKGEEPISYKTICQRFGDLPVYGYWDVYDVLKPEVDEPVFQTLGDDLADIYGDVKRGLSLFDAGYKIEAAWEWRFNFYIHWGAHLTLLARNALFVRMSKTKFSESAYNLTSLSSRRLHLSHVL